MDFGTDLLVFVDDVAVLEHDVLDGNVDGEAFGDLGRVDHAGVGFRGILCDGIGCRRISLGDEIQDVAEVELVALLRHVDIESLHVDFAHGGGLRDDLERVDIDAELLERDERCCSVLFHEGELVDIHGERHRVQAHAFDGDLSTDEFFGMGDDVVLDESRGELERREDEDEKGNDDNGDNFDGFLHARKFRNNGKGEQPSFGGHGRKQNLVRKERPGRVKKLFLEYGM